MKTITLIRHAQSKFNAGQYTSENELINCKLTEQGKKDCEKLNLSFDLLIISPLKRALETYTNSNIKTKEIIINDLFREQKENHPLNFLENEIVIQETTEEVWERVSKAKKFIETLEFTNIGIISHRNFLWYLLDEFEQDPIALDNLQTITFKIK